MDQFCPGPNPRHRICAHLRPRHGIKIQLVESWPSVQAAARQDVPHRGAVRDVEGKAPDRGLKEGQNKKRF